MCVSAIVRGVHPKAALRMIRYRNFRQNEIFKNVPSDNSCLVPARYDRSPPAYDVFKMLQNRWWLGCTVIPVRLGSSRRSTDREVRWGEGRECEEEAETGKACFIGFRGWTLMAIFERLMTDKNYFCIRTKWSFYIRIMHTFSGGKYYFIYGGRALGRMHFSRVCVWRNE